VKLGGGDVSKSALPLDGVDQWPTISTGTPTTRTFIVHNVPITATPILLPSQQLHGGAVDAGSGRAEYTTSVCLQGVDNRTGACHAFGTTGGAIRVGDYKLLVSHVGRCRA
jgi:hypothetical protein